MLGTGYHHLGDSGNGLAKLRTSRLLSSTTALSGSPNGLSFPRPPLTSKPVHRSGLTFSRKHHMSSFPEPHLSPECLCLHPASSRKSNNSCSNKSAHSSSPQK